MKPRSHIGGDDMSAEILEALRRGESWAFDRVYTRYATPLKNYISSLTGNEEEARELNHDVFVALWTGRDKIVPEKGIRGFLFQRATHLAMNWFDHEKVKQRYREFRARNLDAAISPDMQLMGEELRTMIELFLQGLPQQRQAIFRLRHHEGLSVEDIATRLGLSVSTIRNNLSMVTTAIRDLIVVWIFIMHRI